MVSPVATLAHIARLRSVCSMSLPFKGIIKFPGDPRFSVNFSSTKEDLELLKNNKMLKTRLLDYLIHRCASERTSDEKGTLCCGSTYSLFTFCRSNDLLKRETKNKATAKAIRLMREKMKPFEQGHHTIIFPHVAKLHFFVVVIETDENKQVFPRIICYDSLRYSSRRGVSARSALGEFLVELTEFWNNFVLYDSAATLRVQPEHVLKSVEIAACPQQSNEVDCGLFTVAIALHLLEGVKVDRNTFSQNNVSQLREKLTKSFEADANNLHFLPAQTVFSCFPHWSAGQVLRKSSSTAVAAPADEEECDKSSEYRDDTSYGYHTQSDNNDDDRKPAATPTTTITTTRRTITTETTTTTCIDLSDEVMSRILEERGHTTFVDFDDIETAIVQYEEQSGISLGVARSQQGRFRRYVCKEHIGCPFFIMFGRRRSDKLMIVKKAEYQHKGDRRPERASDGRRWKKRRSGTYNDVLQRVLSTKSGRPVSADIVKTAANLKGDVVPYNAAYRVLQGINATQAQTARLSFEMIVPYLNKVKTLNENSVVEYDIDKDNQLTRLFVCPGFMDGILKFVRPVVSLDAAHLKSVYKGMIYIYSVLSASNEAYILAFGIACGNENYNNWSWFNKLFKDACPSLCNKVVTGEPQYDTRSAWNETLFVSDRDKGLDKAINEWFPTSLSINCAKHIEANVKQRFGKKCAGLIIPMSKTFSHQQEEMYIKQLEKANKKAHEYVLKIDPQKWRSTQWLSNAPCPPRYGMVTSNTSESINSMIGDIREEGWLALLDGILDQMLTRISSNRQKYKHHTPNGVIAGVTQILRKSWEDAAAMQVVEIEEDRGDFKISVEIGLLEESGIVANSRWSHNILNPAKMFCSCGRWQDHGYPCAHGVAYYRKWEEWSFQDIVSRKVSRLYHYSSLQGLYTPNIMPTITDGLRHDGKTRPPPLKRMAGRPRVARIRERSKFLDPADSIITCGKCGQRGHNTRTCERRKEQNVRVVRTRNQKKKKEEEDMVDVKDVSKTLDVDTQHRNKRKKTNH